jgi:hypothetical protein
MGKLIFKSLLIFSGILFFLTQPAKSQKVSHQNDWQIGFFSKYTRSDLDSLVAQEWITNEGNKYYIWLIDSCFYENVSFEQLNLGTVLRGGANLWAFRGDDAVEPYCFYIRELQIKFVAGVKEIIVSESTLRENPNNDCLESFFHNSKLYKSKAFRKQKLKEKKAKK